MRGGVAERVFGVLGARSRGLGLPGQRIEGYAKLRMRNKGYAVVTRRWHICRGPRGRSDGVSREW